MIKVDWLVACVLLKEVGDVLVILPMSWLTICKLSQPMGNKGWWLTKSLTLLTNKKQGKLTQQLNTCGSEKLP
jgi:hypothetical protein